MTDQAPPSHRDPVIPGQVISGKYRIERVIGRGGMGLVVEATHLALEERVALKLLRPSVLERPALVARFEREARAAARLKSERVGRVRDVGTTEDGVPFMVMDLLEGEDLAALLARERRLEVTLAVDLAIQACHALAEAHARGVVHRDVKPGNLFLVQTGTAPSVKVLDFGISKVLGGDASLQQTSEILGTPFYMAPEQMRHTASVDHRADIYALGAVLFEMLTGRRPFEARSFPELAAMVLREPAPPADAFCPQLPGGLVAVLARCLEKEPSRRFPSVADLARALVPFASPRGRREADFLAEVEATGASEPSAVTLPERPSLTETVQIAPTLPSAPGMVADPARSEEESLRPAPHRRWLAVAAVLGSAAVLAGVTLGLGIGRGHAQRARGTETHAGAGQKAADDRGGPEAQQPAISVSPTSGDPRAAQPAVDSSALEAGMASAQARGAPPPSAPPTADRAHRPTLPGERRGHRATASAKPPGTRPEPSPLDINLSR